MRTKSVVGNLLLNIRALERAFKEWDSPAIARAKQRIEDELSELPDCFAKDLPTIDANRANIQQAIQSPDYGRMTCDAFERKGIHFKGEFPNFKIPPFILDININLGQVTLKYGRKSERKNCLEPEAIAQWVKQRYDRVVNSQFNALQFANEMITAYEKVNRLISRTPEVRWGQPVPLIDIYEILTIRTTSKKEMPKEVFLFNLTRFIENGLDYRQRRFEFGFSRNVLRMFELIDRDGNSNRYSTLTIHQL